MGDSLSYLDNLLGQNQARKLKCNHVHVKMYRFCNFVSRTRRIMFKMSNFGNSRHIKKFRKL